MGTAKQRFIMHLDMDAFFASVEIARNPELADKPLVVGGSPQGRGVVAAANYIARRYGVHSALPMAVALRRCPQAVVIRPNISVYQQESRKIMALVREYSPRMEQLSIDEAFLDLSEVCFAPEQVHRLVYDLRSKIWQQHSLPTSVGVGESKFIAKLACTKAKPNGAKYIPASQSLDFIHSLELADIWTVGPKTLTQLHDWGIMSVKELAEYPVQKLAKIVGTRHAYQLHALVNNHDSRTVESKSVDKSISSETTFETDRPTLDACRTDFMRLVDKTTNRLRSAQYLTQTVAIKVRDNQFRTLNRSVSLPLPTDETPQIRQAVNGLVQALRLDKPVRLIGVRLEKLHERDSTGYQDSLWSQGQDKVQAVDAVSDSLRAKFGPQILRAASALEPSDSEPTDRSHAGDNTYHGPQTQ